MEADTRTRDRRLLRTGDADPRPLLRGVLHQWAAIVAVVAGVALVVLASGARERTAAALYAVGLVAMLGVSALYHRVWWTDARVRLWIRRLDHSTIFVMIAGTYTPFALLVFEGMLGTLVLVFVWSGALAGIFLKLAWIGSPRWLTALVYIVLGWASLLALPQMIEGAGLGATLLVGAGGALYSLGALVYARKRPNLRPGVFGYHELFHALVIAAAALQYGAVAKIVV